MLPLALDIIEQLTDGLQRGLRQCPAQHAVALPVVDQERAAPPIGAHERTAGRYRPGRAVGQHRRQRNRTGCAGPSVRSRDPCTAPDEPDPPLFGHDSDVEMLPPSTPEASTLPAAPPPPPTTTPATTNTGTTTPIAATVQQVKDEGPRIRITFTKVVDSLDFDIADLSRLFNNSLVASDSIDVKAAFNRAREILLKHTSTLALFVKLKCPDSIHLVPCSRAQLKYKKGLYRRRQQHLRPQRRTPGETHRAARRPCVAAASGQASTTTPPRMIPPPYPPLDAPPHDGNASGASNGLIVPDTSLRR